MNGPVTIVSEHNVPPLLLDELQAIANDVEDCLGVVRMPPIVVRMDCSFATSGRNFAGVITDDIVIMYLCPDFADQPISRIRGVLYHEMGHILQWLEKKMTGRVDQGGRDYEQDCDYKIESTCGVKIYYDEDRVQRVGRRKPHWLKKRPRGLE